MDLIRKQIILDYSKGLLRYIPYSVIETEYNVPRAGKLGDRVRNWIDWYEEKGKKINQYAPGKILDEVASTTTVSDSDNLLTVTLNRKDYLKDKVEVKSSENSLKNLLLKSRWQVQTKNGVEWLESYNNNVDPNDILAFRKELIENLPSLGHRSFTPVQYKVPTMGVISLPDFHIGREKDESKYSIFLAALDSLLRKSMHHNLDHIVFIIGNDYFNSDFDYKTTRGTQQFDYQTWKESWVKGRDILVEAIELIKQTGCLVTVINIPGNHDANRLFYLGDVIQAYYRNDQQVRVDNTDRLIKAFKYGDVLLAFEHGEFKREEYESILANEFPELWGTTKYREFLCGHLHAETVKEFRGLKLRHLPSLATESEWEKKQGYKHRKEAQMLVYSKSKLESIYIE